MAEQMDFDLIDESALRATANVKWSTYPGAIGAFVAEMDFGTAPAVASALRNAVSRGRLSYLSDPLALEVSRACAEWQSARYGWQVADSNIEIVGDVLQALELTIDALTSPGAPIIVPTPAYPPFLSVPTYSSRPVIEVEMEVVEGRYQMNVDALDAAFTAGGELLLLCNPHNPTGRVFTREELTSIAAVVERHGGIVFADEVHAPIVYDGFSHVPYASIDARTAAHTVTATSASKAWNIAGLKCAQVIILDECLHASWLKQRGRGRHSASPLGAVAAVAAYTEGRGWLDETIDYLQVNRGLIMDVASAVNGVSFAQPEGTYSAWLGWNRFDLQPNPAGYFLDHARVAMTDGNDFGQGGAGHTRLVFATPRPVLERTLEKLVAVLPPGER